MRVVGPSLVLVAALGLAVAGCTGESAPSTSSAHAAAAPRSPASTTAAPREPAAAQKIKPGAVHRRCTSVAGVLDTHLVELSSRLSIGLALDAYSTRVGAAQFSYDELFRRHAWARDEVTDRCRDEVVVPLEGALSAYLSAYSIWSECVKAPYCTFHKGAAPLQEAQVEWQHAAVLIEQAETTLASMQPGA
jgi:hypothetical protein